MKSASCCRHNDNQYMLHINRSVSDLCLHDLVTEMCCMLHRGAKRCCHCSENRGVPFDSRSQLVIGIVSACEPAAHEPPGIPSYTSMMRDVHAWDWASLAGPAPMHHGGSPRGWQFGGWHLSCRLITQPRCALALCDPR